MKLIVIFLMSISTNQENYLPDLPFGSGKNEKVKVCGRITEVRYNETSNKQTMITMGGSFQNQPITVIINVEDRKNFSYRPEQFLKNKTACINGKVIDNNGRTEIVISKQDDIKLDDEETGFEVIANDFNFFNKYFDDED